MDHRGQTALSIAEELDHQEIVQILNDKSKHGRKREPSHDRGQDVQKRRMTETERDALVQHKDDQLHHGLDASDAEYDEESSANDSDEDERNEHSSSGSARIGTGNVDGSC